MRSRLTRTIFMTVLAFCAFGLAALAMFAPFEETVADTLYFGAWCVAVILVFLLGLRLPVQLYGRLSNIAAVSIVLAAISLTVLANVALYRHDAHFDVTVSGRFTAPPELTKIAQSLDRDVTLTYFYNTKDDSAYAVKEVLAVVGRKYPRLHVRALDLDTELAAAREYGVKLYNTAVVEAGSHRTQIDNSVDLRQMAYAIERVLAQRTPTICFVTGHGERYETGHVHMSHFETLGSDEPNASGVLEAPADGVDRLKLALETIGYSDRAVSPAMATTIPRECAVLADLGAASAYTPAEVQVVKAYLLHGGRALLAFDPHFPVSPALATLLGEVGLSVDEGVVVDPVNHYGTDQEQAAVPYYPPHPITDQIALTVFPRARPIRFAGPGNGVTGTELIATSGDSYVRPLAPALNGANAAETQSGVRHPYLIGAALQGSWPGSKHEQFRLVLVGNGNFANNTFFPYASNGDLAVSIIRWLAGDTGTPLLRPTPYSLPELRLTHRQMQVTFLLVAVLLPLSVMLFGVSVWWWRR